MHWKWAITTVLTLHSMKVVQCRSVSFRAICIYRHYSCLIIINIICCFLFFSKSAQCIHLIQVALFPSDSSATTEQKSVNLFYLSIKLVCFCFIFFFMRTVLIAYIELIIYKKKTNSTMRWLTINVLKFKFNNIANSIKLDISKH
jgi:hypothetical protein